MKNLKIKSFILGALTMFLIIFIPRIYKHYTYFKLSKYPPTEAVKMLDSM